MLAARGLNEQAVEAILRSKWTRWAGDAANKNDNVTAADLAAFLDDRRNRCTEQAIADLIDQTFGGWSEAAR